MNATSFQEFANSSIYNLTIQERIKEASKDSNKQNNVRTNRFSNLSIFGSLKITMDKSKLTTFTTYDHSFF